MGAIYHVGLSRIGSDHDRWDFHISSILSGCLSVAFQDIVDWRRLAERVEIRVESGSQ
jgi:hypothetical protein